jgi:branched-chain amino acid transport system substrate-binding protein
MNIRRFAAATSILLALCLLTTACSDADRPALGDRSLGVVTIRPGDAVQIRSLSSYDTDDAEARDYISAVELAIEDYGLIHGAFNVELGDAINDDCTADDGLTAAQAVLADASTVGVIGSSCSVTAITAAPQIVSAGMVMISMSNTSPLLTSDLAGNPSQYYLPGYYRTAHNDLYQGEAVAAFLHDTLGPQKVSVVHQGDAYTEGLAQAFRSAVERHEGTITHYIEIDFDTDDLDEVLTRIASGDPDALFFPLYQDAAADFMEAVRQHGGFEDTVLVSADGVLSLSFMELDSSRGVYISGPDLDFGDNTNQATGMNAQRATERFTGRTGAPPVRAFWAHAYDATTLLLDAVTAASRVERGKLKIDRAGIRQYLDQVVGYQGIIGEITCDAYGDCGPGNISVIQHLNPENPESSWDNVVYQFSPQ